MLADCQNPRVLNKSSCLELVQSLTVVFSSVGGHNEKECKKMCDNEWVVPDNSTDKGICTKSIRVEKTELCICRGSTQTAIKCNTTTSPLFQDEYDKPQ